jgi:hypothetical protein
LIGGKLVAPRGNAFGHAPDRRTRIAALAGPRLTRYAAEVRRQPADESKDEDRAEIML